MSLGPLIWFWPKKTHHAATIAFGPAWRGFTPYGHVRNHPLIDDEFLTTPLLLAFNPNAG